MKTVVKNKGNFINKLKDSIKNFVEENNIIGKIIIPSEPDTEGDYYIIVYADNIKSFNKALELEEKLQRQLREKYGDNILISIIPK